MKKIILIIGLISFLVNFSFAQDDKTVTVTVSGQGKTQDEAKQSALRNAIEQAFGTFISSNTEILNDELVKDEIVSIANGNIQRFEILSEVQTPNGEWSNTVKAVVSVSKLTSFCESKGVTVDFKGALFSLNVKQQILNEENEVTAMNNMSKVLLDISNKSFDYEIIVDEPSALDKENKNWKIPITINVNTNKNIQNFTEYFTNTLKGISLTQEEVENYIKLGKPVYTLIINPCSFSAIQDKDEKDKPEKSKEKNKSIDKSKASYFAVYLRRQQSVDIIYSTLVSFRQSIFNFSIDNNVNQINGIEFFASKTKSPRHITKFDREQRQYIFDTDNIDIVEISDFFRIILYNNGINNLSYDQFRNWYPSYEVGLFHANTSSYPPECDYYFANKLAPLKIKQFNDYYNKATQRLDAYKKWVSDPSKCRNCEEFINGVNESFPFFNNLLSDSYQELDLIINLDNLPINKKIAIIKFYDKKSLDELSNISEYKISTIKE